MKKQLTPLFALAMLTTAASAQTASEGIAPSTPDPSATATNTANPASADLEKLRAQVEALTKTVGGLQQQLNQQQQRWDTFNTSASDALAPSPRPRGFASRSLSASAGDELAELRSEVETMKSAQAQAKKSLFNPEISAAVDFISSYSKLGDSVNFTLRDVEVTVQSNVDQFARGYITFNAESELDPLEKSNVFSEVSLGVEEAAIETTALPYGLQLKGGQFFADFTRLGKVHSHDLPFVDRPRSLEKIIGGEAKARGFEMNWLVPIPHYLRLTGGVVDNIGAETPITASLRNLEGETSEDSVFVDRENRPFRSLMAYGRAATFFELGSQTVLRIGGNYAQASQKVHRRIGSADAVLEYRPSAASYDLLSVGGEALASTQSGPFAKNVTLATDDDKASAAGGYLYAQYRFGKQWEPGIRLDFTQSDTFQQQGEEKVLGKFDNSVWTYSTYLTYYFSEFNRVRFQLNYVNGSEPLLPGKGRNDIQAFVQWSVVLGAHKHSFMP